MHVLVETPPAISRAPSNNTRVCGRVLTHRTVYSRSRRCIAAAGGDQDVDELLQEDLRRLQERKQESATTSNLGGGNDEKAPLQDIIDKALIADFFFILFALAWLGVGVGVKSSSGNTGILDAWLGLWQWVFQPAIGVLMLGAIVSGFIGWLKKKM
ncbi:hypothetical protein M9435_000620 [Picochlorum sp. BPE23]|nr:hypothetical protein M9435_000620 [Picochlorum sp. BPE23]